MAASGRISVSVTGRYGNISGYIVWSESDVNTSANTSKVTATLYYANKSGYTTYSDVASPAFYLTINGNTKSTSSGITVSAYSNGVAAITHSVTVAHNDNGSKSITISGGGGLSGTSDLQDSHGSGTATLTSIVRGKPTASLAISLYNSNAVVNGWGVAVRNLTKVDYTISGTPYSGSGSTISSYKLEGNGQSISSASGRTNVLSNFGDNVFKAYVKDSRGIWSDAVSKTVFVYDYAAPKITSAVAYRSNANGEESASGTHIAIRSSASVVGTVGGRNSINSISYAVTNSDSGVVFSKGTLNNNQLLILDNVSEENAYVVSIKATDTIGTNSAQRTISISKSIATFHLAENGVGVAVGKMSEHNNSFEVNKDWDVYFGGEIVDFAWSGGTASGWSWKKWASGTCEMWGTFSASLSQDAVSGGDYYSTTITISTPFQVANAIVTGTAENRYSLINPGGSYANQNISFRLKRGSAISESSISVQIHVCGYWKV